jgi:hypothetical protein
VEQLGHVGVVLACRKTRYADRVHRAVGLARECPSVDYRRGGVSQARRGTMLDVPMLRGSGMTPFLNGVKSSLTCMDEEPFLTTLLPKNGLAGCKLGVVSWTSAVGGRAQHTSSAGTREGEEVLDAKLGVKALAFGLGLKTKAGALALILVPVPILDVEAVGTAAGLGGREAGAIVGVLDLGLKGGISAMSVDVEVVLERRESVGTVGMRFRATATGDWVGVLADETASTFLTSRPKMEATSAGRGDLSCTTECVSHCTSLTLHETHLEVLAELSKAGEARVLLFLLRSLDSSLTLLHESLFLSDDKLTEARVQRGRVPGNGSVRSLSREGGRGRRLVDLETGRRCRSL